MPDLVVHLILDGLPDGAENDRPVMRIVSAPVLGGRYNRLFFLEDNTARLEADLGRVVPALNEAVLSNDESDRALFSPACETLRDHGALLFRALDESSRQLRAITGQAQFHRCNLLLLLQFGDRARGLARCHWEALYDREAERFLIYGGTIARYIPAGLGAPPPLPKMRILSVVSTYGYGSDDAELRLAGQADLESLRRSMRDLQELGIVEPLIELNNPTQRELTEALRKDINVLHFFGHGGVDPRGGEYLILADNNRSWGHRVFVDHLSIAFQPAATPNLRLVVLNACELETQARLGARLVGGFGIPCVVTMKARIGQQVIYDRHGFTETLYREIAAGQAVHEAYRAAIESIWSSSPVETFVPTLTLGVTEPLLLIDKALQPAAEQVRLQNEQRRRPIQDAINSLRHAWTQLDHEALAAALNQALPYAQDPEVVFFVANTIFDGAKGELERHRKANQWQQALRFGRTLENLIGFLPSQGQEEARALRTGVENAFNEELPRIKDAARAFRAQRRWPDLMRECEHYLELRPGDPDITGWLDEARECVNILGAINSLDEGTQVPSTYSQLEDLVRAADIGGAEALYLSIRQQLSPTESAAFQRQILLGKALQARQRGDRATARRAAENLREIDPRNAEAAAILSETLLDEARELLRAHHYDDAEAKCLEAETVAPESTAANEFRSHMFNARIKEARDRADWNEVERLSRIVLDDSRLSAVHGRAAEWRKEASYYKKLFDQIRILGRD